LFLEESGHLCEKALRTSLEDSPPTYSSRSFGVNPYIDLLHFNSKKKLAYNIPALSLQEALNSSGLLRNYLAPALGLSNTDRMYNILWHLFFSIPPIKSF
jgi:hypothetical protein